KSPQISANCERKANKKEKNNLLGFVTTCCGLAGCVGSGQTESVNEERCQLHGWGIPVSDAARPSPARARPRLRWNQSRAVLSSTGTLFRAFNEPVLACVFHVEVERARAASARHHHAPRRTRCRASVLRDRFYGRCQASIRQRRGSQRDRLREMGSSSARQ